MYVFDVMVRCYHVCVHTYVSPDVCVQEENDLRHRIDELQKLERKIEKYGYLPTDPSCRLSHTIVSTRSVLLL